MVEDAYSSGTSVSPLVRSSEFIQIKEVVLKVALNPPNKALAALVENAKSSAGEPRRVDRTKAVLPVRISGSDLAGASYCELVHTLDVSPNGVRLGAVRRQLEIGSLVTLHYRQHKAEFHVVWMKPLGSGAEQQIGLEARAQRDLWGLDVDAKNRPQGSPGLGNHVSIGA
jgi:hypothetical protein